MDIYINSIIDPQLPHEQAGFRKGRSIVNQVTLLTQDIEDCFETKETAGSALVDVSVAPRVDPKAPQVHFLVGVISNRKFVLKTTATDSEANYADSRTVSPRDLSWLHDCLIRRMGQY